MGRVPGRAGVAGAGDGEDPDRIEPDECAELAQSRPVAAAQFDSAQVLPETVGVPLPSADLQHFEQQPTGAGMLAFICGDDVTDPDW